MGTGAFTAAELRDRDVSVTVSDDSTGLVSLNANSDYPEYIGEENGELGIDFDYDGYGVNPNSTYQVGQVPSDLGGLSAIKDDPLSEGDITDDYAFSIGNNSSSTQNIEVDIDMDAVPDDVTLYLIARATDVDESDASAPGDEGSAVGAVSTNDRQSVLSFTADSSGNIPAGRMIHVTLLIVRDSKGNTGGGSPPDDFPAEGRDDFPAEGRDDFPGEGPPGEGDTGEGTAWEGSMTVRAGEHDDIQEF